MHATYARSASKAVTIRVEFYGIPRQRAGVDHVTVEASTLGEALAAAGRKLPTFADACLAGNRLQPGYLANVNGERFTTNSTTRLGPDDVVLVLSADVGG